VALSPDGRTLAVADWQNTVRLWDAQTGELMRTLPLHSALVGSLAFSPDGKTVASASNDTSAKLWQVEAPPR
jgi:WD40 repeat protein